MNYNLDKKQHYEDNNFLISPKLSNMSLKKLEYRRERYEEFHSMCKNMENYKLMEHIYWFCEEKDGVPELLICYLQEHPNPTKSEIAEHLLSIINFAGKMKHITLEERAAKFGGKLMLDGEYDLNTLRGK